MKITIRFEPLKKNAKVKELGNFFQQNQDFYIHIDVSQAIDQKVTTFIEEMLHFLIRVYCSVLNKRVSVKKEHDLIRQVVQLFQKVIGE
ncbi:MAG: hypothetical protein QXS37_04795 [Candidatus Aenigmatarchaeota archaeon]